MRNHGDIASHVDKLWRTLSELITAESVLPWDVQANGLPLGMSAIKMVQKSGTDKMRVVFVLCDINTQFCADAGKCTLN